MSFTRFNSSNSFKRFSQPSSTDPYDTTSLENQISNATTRIQDAGYKTENTDKRNWFEKLTNLPQKQNAFFDALELLGRPGQAVMGAVKSKQEGGGSSDALKAAVSGVSGKTRTRGTDLLDGSSIKNPVMKTIVGTGLELALDPLMYVPGGVLAKGVTIPGKAVGKAVSRTYKAAEKAIPSFGRFSENALRPAAQNAKDGLGHMFKPQYKWEETLGGGKDDTLKRLSNETDNKIRYQTEESMRNVGNIAKATGIQAGDDVGRIMEKDLKITKDRGELLSGILKGDNLKVNLADGDIRELVGGINQRVLGSKIVTDRILKKSDQLKEATKGIEELSKKHDLEDLLYRSENGASLTKVEEAALAKMGRYQKAVNLLTKDIETTKRGVQLNPLDTAAQRTKGEGFEVVNPMSKLYKKAIGNQSKFLDDIAPKGSFDKIVKPELKQELRPIVETLLQSGRVVTENLKGTAKEAELKRLFGSDISMLSKRKTTITLKQGNNDQKYFNLEGAKPVIPESLTNPNKLIPDDGLKFDDLQFTDRGKPITLERPMRETSDSPLINVAAKRLMESNDEIRQMAESSGINISEIQGYMTHILTQAARDAKRSTKVQGGNFGIGQPNKAILKNRKYDGSVEDINELYDKGIFNPNAYFSTAIGQKRLIEYIHAESFKRQVLSNRNFATPFQKGMTVPDNAVVINPDQYKFFKISTPEGNEFMGMGKGQEYLVTKGAKDALDRYQRLATDEGTKGFLRAYDAIQSFWKRSALFSLGYHARNQAGAMFNNLVGGMNPIELGDYTQQGFREVARFLGGKESKLFNEYRQQGLSASALSKVEFAKYGEEPEKAIERTVANLSRDTKGQVTQRLNPLNAFKTSQEVGNFFDQANRFALYKWAREKKGLSPEKAAEKVREVQFDYSRTTPFESNIIARVVPFYRWMRNNIPFQIKQFINDPRKYQGLNALRMNAQDTVGLDDENIPTYMKENFMLPVMGEGGKGRFLGLNLPLSDLTKLSRPGKTVIDSISPILKTPAELALNYNTFRGKEIQKFVGQEQKYKAPLIGDFGIPIKSAYAFEQATGQIGRGLSGLMQKPENVDQDVANRLPTLGISSLTKQFDAEKFAYYEKLNELQQLQDLILFIEQQSGEKPRTVREIKKGQ